MNQRIRDLIGRGYTLVTASNRQAHTLRTAWSAAMLSGGETVWRTPEVLPWQTWLHECRQHSQGQSDTCPILLNSSQARLIWQSIIESSAYTDSVLQVNSIVNMAMLAYETCLAWRIDIFPDDIFLNGDARAFQSWFKSYRRKLEQNHWVDDASLPAKLVESGFVPTSQGLVLYGFDELTPQQTQFVEHLKNNGCDVLIFDFEGRNDSTVYHGYPELMDELVAAARWTKAILGAEPRASIGIIIPELDQNRDKVSAVFDDVLHPEWVLQSPGSMRRLYSIAPGRSLSDYPLIHTAMEILSLGHTRHTIERFEFLLRSSFIKGGISESGKRARFYASLREVGEPVWHLNTLLDYIGQHQQYMPVANEFTGMLAALLKFIDTMPVKQTSRQWTETFTAWLKLFGWPGDRSLNSSEYQTIKEWHEALLETAGLGMVSGIWSYDDALRRLKEVLDRRSFQPETTETPVQISGLPGVAGMGFDYLRITGMHDLNWPGTAIVNPFIPLALQRQAGVPGCTAGLSVQRCIRETETLIKTCQQVVFSYAEREGDRECRPSPLLLPYLEARDVTLEPPHEDYKQLVYASGELDSFIDELAPPPVNDEMPAGGTAILSDQSACAFRAFARHRLDAHGLAAIEIGLDPRVRGSLVHEVMHEVWKRIGNSENLRDLTDNKLDTLVRALAAGVVRERAKEQPETFTAEFRRLETRRLISLVKSWLAIEKSRPAFKIRELEKRHEANFHGLKLRMRIDRIDEFPDGSLLVLDYKTGEVHTRKWQGERPEEPQLPLYAITVGGNVKAVAFAGMKKGQLGFAGYSENSDLIEGITPVSTTDSVDTWNALLEDWERVLGILAEEYRGGQVSVTPRDSKACEYCDLHSFCRIHERLGAVAGMIEEFDSGSQDQGSPVGE